MKREREEEMKSARGGSLNIFFFDLASMSTSMSIVYLLGIMAFFGIIFWILIKKIMTKPVDFTKQKRSERQQKKASKSGEASSGSKKNL